MTIRRMALQAAVANLTQNQAITADASGLLISAGLWVEKAGATMTGALNLPDIIFSTGYADKKLYSPADGDLEWFTHNSAAGHGFAVSHQGTKCVYLNTTGNSYFNGGNVGIGTVSPGSLMNPSASSVVQVSGTNPLIALRHSTDTLKEFSIFQYTSGVYIDSSGSSTATNNGIYFRVGNTNSSNGSLISAMAILSNGNIGIGTVGPAQLLSVGPNSEFNVRSTGVMFPVQAPTASAPTYVKGGVYFDTTLNKLRVGGATAWETVTSV